MLCFKLVSFFAPDINTGNDLIVISPESFLTYEISQTAFDELKHFVVCPAVEFHLIFFTLLVCDWILMSFRPSSATINYVTCNDTSIPVTGSWCPGAQPNPADYWDTWESISKWPKYLGPTTHMKVSDGVPGSTLCPDPMSAAVTIWGTNQ